MLPFGVATPALDNAELAMLKAASEILRIPLVSIQVDLNLFICLIP